MKSRQLSLPFFAIALLATALGFQNCGQVKFSQLPSTSSNSTGTQATATGNPDTSGSTTPTNPPPTVGSTDTTGTPTDHPGTPPTQGSTDLVNAACSSGTPLTKAIMVEFPRASTTCDWGHNGNLSILDGFFRARREQVATFSMPQGAIICGLDFKFPVQHYQFDDHFLFVMDGLVLASSYNFDSMLNQVGNFRVYDWSKIVGQPWFDRNTGTGLEGTFCVGKSSGLSQCSWPVTEQTGQIQLSFAPSLIQSVMAFDTARTNHSFMFSTTGDNDSTDCLHDGFTFDLEIKYVQP